MILYWLIISSESRTVASSLVLPSKAVCFRHMHACMHSGHLHILPLELHAWPTYTRAPATHACIAHLWWPNTWPPQPPQLDHCSATDGLSKCITHAFPRRFRVRCPGLRACGIGQVYPPRRIPSRSGRFVRQGGSPGPRHSRGRVG